MNCDFCNKEFHRPKAWLKRSKTKCCSKECAYNLKKRNSIKTCKQCGIKFYKKHHQKDKLFCSRKCSSKNRSNELFNKICKFCSKTFIGFIFSQYCSVECSRHKTKKIEISCDNCGLLFKRIPSEIKKAQNRVKTKSKSNKFCSKECRNQFMTGPNHYEYKENLHDKSLKTALKQWATLIKEKYNYTCVDCGESRKNLLEAHHIKSRSQYPELAFDIENGIAVCVKCHLNYHKEDPKAYRLIFTKYKKLYEKNTDN